MIIKYTEEINGVKKEFSYDSHKVKAGCVDCHKYMTGWEMHEIYKKRGNYCETCNAKYSHIGKTEVLPDLN